MDDNQKSGFIVIGIMTLFLVFLLMLIDWPGYRDKIDAFYDSDITILSCPATKVVWYVPFGSNQSVRHEIKYPGNWLCNDWFRENLNYIGLPIKYLVFLCLIGVFYGVLIYKKIISTPLFIKNRVKN